jgi:citrate synthase
MPKTHAEKLADLKAKLAALVKKNPQFGDEEVEDYRHKSHRLRAKHDALTADQKRMNELERTIRTLEAKKGGTRRHRRKRGTRRH